MFSILYIVVALVYAACHCQQTLVCVCVCVCVCVRACVRVWSHSNDPSGAHRGRVQAHLENLVRVVLEELRTDRIDNARGSLCRIPLVPIKACATHTSTTRKRIVVNSRRIPHGTTWHYNPSHATCHAPNHIPFTTLFQQSRHTGPQLNTLKYSHAWACMSL